MWVCGCVYERERVRECELEEKNRAKRAKVHITQCTGDCTWWLQTDFSGEIISIFVLILCLVCLLFQANSIDDSIVLQLFHMIPLIWLETNASHKGKKKYERSGTE